MKHVSKICTVLQMETSYVVMAHNACKINNAAEIIVVKKMKFVMANNAKKLYLYNQQEVETIVKVFCLS